MSDFIVLSEAIDMTRLFRGMKESILHGDYQGLQILPQCETFDAAQVKSMLGNTNCVGMRIYYGMDENKKIHGILVGVDNEGKDILPENEQAGNYILERGIRCPDNCPPTSPLNS